MNLQSIILFLAIGLIAGWLVSKIMRGRGLGLVGDLAIGVIGAFLGWWLFGLLKISIGGILGSFITAVVGAVVLLFLIRLLTRL